MRIIVGAKPWLVGATGCLVVAALAGTAIGNYVAHRPPSPCEEKAELRDHSDSAWRCDGGSRMEVFPVSGGFRGLSLFKCTCPATPVERTR